MKFRRFLLKIPKSLKIKNQLHTSKILRSGSRFRKKINDIIRLFIEIRPLSHVIVLKNATLIFKKLKKQYKIRGYITRDII